MVGRWAVPALAAALVLAFLSPVVVPRPAEGAPRPATAPMRGLDGQSPTGDQVRADFNGDGYSDLAMLQDWSVRIMYGSPDGFNLLNSVWIADTSIGGP